MARLWSSGFELQSTTSGVEWDTTTGSPSISTATHNVGGLASLRCNPTAATAYIRHTLRVDSTGKVFARFYVYIASLPSGDTKIFQFVDSVPDPYVSLRITSTGTLKAWDEVGNSQIGTTSSALSTSAWHLIEMSYDDANASNLVTLKVDGSAVFTDATGVDANGWGIIYLGVGTSATCDIYFDDLAFNDTSGSYQTGFPGAGSIVHLKPNGTGDSSTAGLAFTGAATGWQCIDEVTPDDATSYVQVANTTDTLDVALESSSTAGISSTNTISLVAVGQRGAAFTAAACSLNFNVRSASGGTPATSGNVVRNTTAFSTHDDTAGLSQYKVTSYIDPTTSVAWTATGTNSLDNAQIGFTCADATPDPQVTAMWLLVDYVPSTATNYDITKTAQYAVPNTPSDLTKSAQYLVASPSTDITKTAAYAVRKRMDQLKDGFNGSTVDGATWTSYTGGRITVDNELQIATLAASGYAGIYTNERYDLTGSYAKVHLENNPITTYESLEATLDLNLDADNRLQFIWYIGSGVGRWSARRRVAAVNTDVASITYDHATMNHIRIREASGTVYWDYSGDGVNWTNLGSWVSSINVKSLLAELNAGQWQAEAGGSSIVFDDFNLDLSEGTVTKTADYDVAVSSDVTKGADYDVASSPDITKSAEYVLAPSENLDSSWLKKLKIGKKYGPVTSVILGRIPQNDNVVIARVSPEANTISSISTSTNLFTATANAMVDGNLVRLESTGTLPAPFVAGVNYYVYTNGDPDTFALTGGYEDGLNGTNIIDITSVGSGTITLSHLETQEVQINNNQIVDDDRQDLLPPIYKELVGLEWHEVTAETVGLGWHEVGDVVKFTQGDVTVKGFISNIHLVLEGSIKESLVSTIPDVATINYQTSGGILKTLYNTEIKVDKQENDITSVVSQQIVYEDQTQTNFTELYQNITDILLTIQQSGGGNILLNSVGFATVPTPDNAAVSYDKLEFWDYNPSYQVSTHGTALSYQSSESQNNGGIAGQVIELSGASIYITQRVSVAADTALSFGLRVKNLIGTGDALITISNDNESQTITIDDVAAYDWEEIKIEDFVSTLPWLDIKIAVTSATSFVFTDLRLLYGSNLQAWVQSPAEILSTNVQFTKNGMRIFDSVHDTETQVTYNEFSTRRKADGVILFEADDTGVVTRDLGIKGQTTYNDSTGGVIKQVTIPKSSALAGIAFILVS